jgi:hypothetical protein
MRVVARRPMIAINAQSNTIGFVESDDRRTKEWWIVSMRRGAGCCGADV